MYTSLHMATIFIQASSDITRFILIILNVVFPVAKHYHAFSTCDLVHSLNAVDYSHVNASVAS